MSTEAARSSSSRRAVVASRDQVALLGLSAYVREKGWKVDAVAPADAVAACRKSPHAALLVLDLSRIDEAKVAAAAKKAVKSLRVLATIGERNAYLVKELEDGDVSSIVYKGSPGGEVEKAFDVAFTTGDFLCSTCRADVAAAGKTRGLSPRETEVLRLLGYGNTNSIVGQMLKISEKTVEAHRSNIKRKLGARGLSDLVRYAISIGLVDTKDPIPAE